MKNILSVRFQVVYYDPENGRQIFHPADNNSAVLASKLRECQDAGHTGARLSEVAAN